MKKVIFPIVALVLVIAACKKDKIECRQSDVNLDYHRMNQYDSAYTTTKLCVKESQWESLEFEGSFNPNTGVSDPISTSLGTVVTTFYNSVRNDSVTRTTKTYSVPE